MSDINPGLTNFNGGEISDLMSARTDFDKFASSCHRLRRFLPTVQGPARRMGGTRFVAGVRIGAEWWLSRFEYAYDQAYLLEWTDGFVRFYTDEGPVLSATVLTINAVTLSAPARFGFTAAHGFAPNDVFYAEGMTGTTLLNNRFYQVITVVSATEVEVANADQSFVIRTQAYIAGGTAREVYKVAHPWSAADLTTDEGTFALDMAQSADVLYIARPDSPCYTLTRSAANSWAFAQYLPNDGPFQALSAATSHNVQLGAATGSTTMATTVPYFGSTWDDEGGILIKLDKTPYTSPVAWQPGIAVGAGAERISDGKVYLTAAGGTTGVSTPIHERGTKSDGGVLWEYQHPGYVIVRVTSVTSNVLANVDILGPGVAPSQLVIAPGTTERTLGAWGPVGTDNFQRPSNVAFWQERLWWGGNQSVWSSVAGDFGSMAGDTQGEVLADNAISLLLNAGGADKIRWMSGRDDLLIGTAGYETAVKAATANEVIGPTNVRQKVQSNIGSRRITPPLAGDALLFTTVGGRLIHEFAYDAGIEKWLPRDLTALYPDVALDGIVDMAFQRKPDAILWCVLATGRLVSLTYDRQQNVYGWHQHEIAGLASAASALAPKVKAVQVLTSPDGSREDVWLIVERNIGVQVVRYMERLIPPQDQRDDPVQGSYLDSHLVFSGAVDEDLDSSSGADTAGATVTFATTGAPFVVGDIGRQIKHRYYDTTLKQWRFAIATITSFTAADIVGGLIVAPWPTTFAEVSAGDWGLSVTSVRGLYHMDGEALTIMSDGEITADVTVADGTVALPVPSVFVIVGYPYTSILATNRIEIGLRSGTAQGKVKRIAALVARFVGTLGGQFGPSDTLLDVIPYRTNEDLVDELPPPVTGDTDRLPFPSGYETDGRIWIVTSEPFAMVVAGLYPEMDVNS